jgi:CheY-like chemotaxis protein
MADDPIVHLTVNGRRPRVAIVGGSPASATIATILVEQFGCQPLAAAGAEAALALLRGDAAIDLILLDLALPDMDGIVAAQLIRALGAGSGLPIVALTDDSQRLEAPRARAAGFSGSVVKPYSPRELYAALDTAFARRTTAPVLGHA